MNPEIQKEALEMVKQLADKLGTTAEHLWSVLVKEAVIGAWTNLALLGVALFTSVCFVVWAFIQDQDEGWKGLALGVLVILVLVGCLMASTNIPRLINPEYWAFKQLWK